MKKIFIIIMMSSMIFLVGCGGVKGNTYSNDECSLTFTDKTNCVITEGNISMNATYVSTTEGYTISIQLGIFPIEYYVEEDGQYIIVTNNVSNNVDMLKKE